MTALVTAAPNQLSVAYAHCERLARRHYENFPVASYLLPAEMRPHIAAIYAFARTADDLADEPGLADAERIRRLDDWRDRLVRLTSLRKGYGGPPTCPPKLQRRRKLQLPPGQPDLANDDLIFLALAHTIDAKQLPVNLFEDLLSAFRQDVTTTRHANWTDVLDYCRRSANPVGRLVLRVAGYDDSGMDAASDALCTALQLTNFWQDFARDWQMGRLYLPLDERDRAGAVDTDLDARRLTPEWRQVLQSAAVRTRKLFDAGRPVCDRVSGRLRWELRLTWLGGMRILEKLRADDFNVFDHRPTLGAADAMPLFWQALRWNRD